MFRVRQKKVLVGEKKVVNNFHITVVGRASSVLFSKERRRERESEREGKRIEERERECVHLFRRDIEREYIYIYKCLLKKKGGKGLEIS